MRPEIVRDSARALAGQTIEDFQIRQTGSTRDEIIRHVGPIRRQIDRSAREPEKLAKTISAFLVIFAQGAQSNGERCLGKMGRLRAQIIRRKAATVELRRISNGVAAHLSLTWERKYLQADGLTIHATHRRRDWDRRLYSVIGRDQQAA